MKTKTKELLVATLKRVKTGQDDDFIGCVDKLLDYICHHNVEELTDLPHVELETVREGLIFLLCFSSKDGKRFAGMDEVIGVTHTQDDATELSSMLLSIKAN